jgi:ribonuclease-3 family protein
MILNFVPELKKALSEDYVINLNPLVLAFIGDSVQTLYVRTRLVANTSYKAGQLHKLTSEEIKAEFQADIIKHIMEKLTDKEIEIFKRGRNSHSQNTAKNASVEDYRKASGFEAVIGYLYLTAQNERLEYLLNLYTTANPEKTENN